MNSRDVLVAVGAAALLLAGTVAWHWWTHPTAFSDLGDSFRSDPLPLAKAPLSTTVIFPKVGGSAESIEINDLDATFSANTAKARATFWVCHMGANEDPIGAVHDPAATCGDIEAFLPPMEFNHGIAPNSDYLFVTITPTRRGTAYLESVDIDYQRSGSHGFQRGTQTLLVDRRITAR
ncbi:hypothetical protein BH09ACT12_BH09ACT12_25810 [soil metagenome]